MLFSRCRRLAASRSLGLCVGPSPRDARILAGTLLESKGSTSRTYQTGSMGFLKGRYASLASYHPPSLLAVNRNNTSSLRETVDVRSRQLSYTSSLRNEGTSTPPMPPHVWLEVLEKTAYAPWMADEERMTGTPNDPFPPELKLERAHIRIYQIFTFLGRPQESEEDGFSYLVDFEKSPSNEDSELTRARNAIAILMRSVVRDFTSIPVSSPLRAKHTQMFDVFGALVPLHDAYLAGSQKAPEVPQWSEFWDRAQPVLLTLGMQLAEAGFGIKEDKDAPIAPE